MDIAVRRWNEIGREAHRAGAELWQDEFLARHFTPEAKTRYHHQPRRPKYIKAKARAAARGFALAPDIDNLYTGRLYHNLQSTAAIKAYPSRATISMIGPRYITMRAFQGDHSAAFQAGWTYGKGEHFQPTAGLQPDKKKEILTDTDDEVEQIVALIERKLWAGVQENRGSKSTDL